MVPPLVLFRGLSKLRDEMAGAATGSSSTDIADTVWFMIDVEDAPPLPPARSAGCILSTTLPPFPSSRVIQVGGASCAAPVLIPPPTALPPLLLPPVVAPRAPPPELDRDTDEVALVIPFPPEVVDPSGFWLRLVVAPPGGRFPDLSSVGVSTSRVVKRPPPIPDTHRPKASKAPINSREFVA